MPRLNARSSAFKCTHRPYIQKFFTTTTTTTTSPTTTTAAVAAAAVAIGLLLGRGSPYISTDKKK